MSPTDKLSCYVPRTHQHAPIHPQLILKRFQTAWNYGLHTTHHHTTPHYWDLFCPLTPEYTLTMVVCLAVIHSIRNKKRRARKPDKTSLPGLGDNVERRSHKSSRFGSSKVALPVI